VELAPRDVAAGEERIAALERPELARHEALRLEVVRIGRHVHRRREAGMRDGAVVALEEVLARDLPVRRDVRLGPEAELQRVQVDDLGQLRGDVAERFGEGRRVRVRVDEHEWPPGVHLNADESELRRIEVGLGVRPRRCAEVAIEVVRPGVIRTLEGTAVPLRRSRRHGRDAGRR
jgi:hypothetical protein